MASLTLFTGRCGHRWIGHIGGYFGCPVCGEYDGDHHITEYTEFPVQVEDWGCAWDDFERRKDRDCRIAETIQGLFPDFVRKQRP